MPFSHPESCATPFADLLPLQTRSFAAVIFRRIASKSRKMPNDQSVETFLSLPPQQGHAIRQQLLEALGAETSNPVRNKIGDAVAEIARQYSDGSMYPTAHNESFADSGQRSNGQKFWGSCSPSAYHRMLDNEKSHIESFRQRLA